MAKKYGFRIIRNLDQRSNIEKLVFQFISKDEFSDTDEYRNSRQSAVEFSWVRWLNDDSLPDNRWSAFEVNVPSFSHVEDMKVSVNLVNRVLGGNSGRQLSPQTILQTLRKKNFTELFLDNRVHKFLPLDEVAPAEYHTWETKNVNYCLTALAKDEDEARELLDVKFQEPAFYEKDKKEFAYWGWQDRGKPVGFRYSYHGNLAERPDTRPAEERIALDGQYCVECGSPLNGDELRYESQLETHCLDCFEDKDTVDLILDNIKWGL